MIERVTHHQCMINVLLTNDWKGNPSPVYYSFCFSFQWLTLRKKHVDKRQCLWLERIFGEWKKAQLNDLGEKMKFENYGYQSPVKAFTQGMYTLHPKLWTRNLVRKVWHIQHGYLQ